MSNKTRPIHPGEILKDELAELGISANTFAQSLGVPTNRITCILNKQRSIAGDTALRLSHYFGTTPGFWMNLRATYELKITKQVRWSEIQRTVKPVVKLAVRYPGFRGHF